MSGPIDLGNHTSTHSRPPTAPGGEHFVNGLETNVFHPSFSNLYMLSIHWICWLLLTLVTVHPSQAPPSGGENIDNALETKVLHIPF